MFTGKTSELIGPDLRSRNSLDRNRVDYKVGDILKERMHQLDGNQRLQWPEAMADSHVNWIT